MYEELVEKLRHRGTLYNGISLFDDAANAIETLESELDRLRRERDQAAEDLKINSKCSICKNNPKGKDARKCKYYDTCGLAYQFWQWRGVQEENNG